MREAFPYGINLLRSDGCLRVDLGNSHPLYLSGGDICLPSESGVQLPRYGTFYSVSDRYYHYYRTDSDNDAEHGQDRTHLVVEYALY